MPAIIYNSLRILNSDTFAERILGQPTFVFIGKETPWPDEEIAPWPLESEQQKIQLYKDMVGVKRIVPGSVSSVIPRVDWTANEIYDAYDHRVNMIDGRKPNGSKYQFYVLTDEFNVYKCIDNNYGARSTTKPTSQQITTFQTPDGYTWKYMYSILSTDVFDFMTKDWMPVYTVDVNNGSSQWNVQQAAVDGAIMSIVLDTRGIGYSPVDPPNVVITGDGEGAQAVVEVNPIDGSLSRIIVTNPGHGYTEANITFTNTGGGIAASATAILSPAGGHGKDARRELGGVHKMIKLNLDGSEGGAFPITSFRQAGLIYKVMSEEIGARISVQYNDDFSAGDIITGGTSGATGRVRLVDDNGIDLWVEDVVGNFIQSEIIANGTHFVQSSNVDMNANLPLTEIVAGGSNIKQNSGEVLYVSNRLAIQRQEGQSEECRMIITF